MAWTASDAGVRARSGAEGLLDAGARPAAVSAATATPTRTTSARRSTGSLARVTLGLVVILALVMLGGSGAVRAFERRAGLAMITGSGLPFLVLGAVARRPEVGVLDDRALADLAPLLEFGLGWIGFRVGADFDVRAMDRWPRGTARVMVVESVGAFAVTALATAVALRAGLHPSTWLRDALLLGACAAVSAPSGVRALEHAGVLRGDGSRSLRRVAALDDVMALLALGIVTSVFRPVQSAAWALPPLGWLFVQIGMGAVLGAVLAAVVRAARDSVEELALTLGGVSFASGMAGHLGFSPLVVASVAGMVVANLPSAVLGGAGALSRERLREVERTVYMAFFVVVGARWEPSAALGWALLPVYVAARALGKLAGLRAVRDQVRAMGVTWVALMPASAVSIAVVVSAEAAWPSLMRGALETVVLVGAVASEVIFRAGSAALGAQVATEDAGIGALAMEHDAPDERRSSP